VRRFLFHAHAIHRLVEKLDAPPLRSKLLPLRKRATRTHGFREPIAGIAERSIHHQAQPITTLTVEEAVREELRWGALAGIDLAPSPSALASKMTRMSSLGRRTQRWMAAKIW
jgi:hypothetical protein